MDYGIEAVKNKEKVLLDFHRWGAMFRTMRIADTIREMREVIVRIAAKHGATQVRLIGSVARGDARCDSDVDLLVTWSEGTSLLDHAALMLDLEGLLGRKVDIASAVSNK